ncbi:MAG: rRNA maturation RNase YbeY [bacterium]|nr:rRNA maturation RNase YbeY [bacterium]
MLEAEDAPTTIEVSVTLVGNSYIRRLNQKYRKVDSPTDVLAFGIEVPGKGFLGDVYISLDMAVKRACKNNTLCQLEVSRYLIHGILHLLGYKHDKQMKACEEYYLMTPKKNIELKELNKLKSVL